MADNKYKGIINRKVINRVKKYFMPSRQKIAILGMATLCVIGTVVTLVLKTKITWPILFAAFAVLFAGEYFLMLRKYANMYMRQMDSVYHSDQCSSTVKMENTTLKVLPEKGKTSATIKYKSFNKFIPMDDAYILISKDMELVTIDRAGLSKEQDEDLLELLKEKCPGLVRN